MISFFHDQSPTQCEDILSHLGDIGLSLHQLQDRTAMLEAGVRAVRELFESDRTLVYQLLPQADGVVLAESVGADIPAILGQLIYDPCLERTWIEPYRQGRTSAVDDIDTSPLAACHIELLTRLQVKANLVAPIVVPAAEVGEDSQLWGLLIIHECYQPRPWRPIHHQVLKHIGADIGLALRHCQTRHQLMQAQVAITAHKQLEQQLRQRDEMLRKISEQIPGVIFQYRLYPSGKSCFPYTSEAIRQIYEVTPEQVKTDAQPVLGRLHLEDHDRVVASMWHSFNTLELWYDEYRVCLPERGLRWLEGHAMPEKLEDGSVLWHGYIRDITERKQMEAQIQQEVQQERMIALIDQRIVATLDLETILQTTVEEVRRFLATDRVVVYQLQPNWSGLVMAESVAPGWMAILAQEITDAYLVETQGGSYHDNHVNSVDDIYAAGFSDCHLELLEWMQVRAKLVVPIHQGDHLWGLLIAHHCQGPRQWQASERRLLQQLASQLALAIQHAELHHQLQSANQELEHLSNTEA